jgi:uncharacterized protein (TIGR03083 family)
MDRNRVVTGIRADAGALVASLTSLPPAAFDRPTPCAAWDVRHLVAHLYRDFERVPESSAARTMASADTDEISYWQYNRATNHRQSQDRASLIASRFESPATLVTALAQVIDTALTLARLEPPAPQMNVRLPWGPVITFDDLLRTRWVELVVHSLDLADALDAPPTPSLAGLEFTTHTLGALAALASGESEGDEGSAVSLRGWPDAAHYIRAMTGRRSLGADDLALVGPDLAARLPLIA